MHAGLLGPSTVAARPRGAASAAPAYAARPSAAASPSLSPSSPVRLSPAPGRLAGSLVVVRAVGGKGGGVLDRPDLDVNKATVKSAAASGLLWTRGRRKCCALLSASPAAEAVLAPKYKLLLHNDPVNRRDYVRVSHRQQGCPRRPPLLTLPRTARPQVVTILLKVVDGLTNDDATRISAPAEAVWRQRCPHPPPSHSRRVSQWPRRMRTASRW